MPGAVTVNEDDEKGGWGRWTKSNMNSSNSSSNSKNAKRREARRRAKKVAGSKGGDDDDDDDDGDGLSSAAAGKEEGPDAGREGKASLMASAAADGDARSLTQNAPAATTDDPEQEREEARKLQKKLRQARELREKKDNGGHLLPEQLEKVIKINELLRQLNSLGFDPE